MTNQEKIALFNECYETRVNIIELAKKHNETGDFAIIDAMVDKSKVRKKLCATIDEQGLKAEYIQHCAKREGYELDMSAASNLARFHEYKI